MIVPHNCFYRQLKREKDKAARAEKPFSRIYGGGNLVKGLGSVSSLLLLSICIDMVLTIHLFSLFVSYLVRNCLEETAVVVH